MERKPVQSSNIMAIGYDYATEELEIEFKSGGVYRYLDVPWNVNDEFVASDSKGKFFAQKIKPKFEYRRVVMLAAIVAGEPCHGESS